MLYITVSNFISHINVSYIYIEKPVIGSPSWGPLSTGKFGQQDLDWPINLFCISYTNDDPQDQCMLDMFWVGWNHEPEEESWRIAVEPTNWDGELSRVDKACWDWWSPSPANPFIIFSDLQWYGERKLWVSTRKCPPELGIPMGPEISSWFPFK